MWKFQFCSSFPSHITKKLYGINEHSTHQTTTLLSEMSIFWVRAACKLKSVSYGSRRIWQSLRYTIFCVLTCIARKLQVVYGHSRYQTTALLSEMSIFWVRAPCEIWLASYGSKCTSLSLSKMPFMRTSMQNLKTTSHMWMFCLSNDCSTIEDIPCEV